MTIEPPKKEDLKRIADENHFELSDSEADAIGAMLTPIIGFLDRIDQIPIEPSPSVRRYRDREADHRPTRDRHRLLGDCVRSQGRAGLRWGDRWLATGQLRVRCQRGADAARARRHPPAHSRQLTVGPGAPAWAVL